MSDLTLNGALALLTVPREPLDDNLVESVVSTLDASEELAESIRSQAEIARRKVLLGAAERNLEAIGLILDQLGVARKHAELPILQKWFLDIGVDFDLPDLGSEYQTAVVTNDYERAFALAEWLHACSGRWLGLVKALAARGPNRKIDGPFTEWFTAEFANCLVDSTSAPTGSAS